MKNQKCFREYFFDQEKLMHEVECVIDRNYIPLNEDDRKIVNLKNTLSDIFDPEKDISVRDFLVMCRLTRRDPKYYMFEDHDSN